MHQVSNRPGLTLQVRSSTIANRKDISTKNNSTSSNINNNNNTRLSSKIIIRSNLVLISLILWGLALPVTLARQNHHQTCPGCPHQQHGHNLHRSAKESGPSPDDLRLEAIKHQILIKLGLRNRPDVNKTLVNVPKELALKTLYRAEAQPPRRNGRRNNYEEGKNEGYSEFLYSGDEYSYRNLDQPMEDISTDGAAPTTTPFQGYDYPGGDYEEPQEEMDDFYARTSEIITFAEPGTFYLFPFTRTLFLFTFSLCFKSTFFHKHLLLDVNKKTK